MPDLFSFRLTIEQFRRLLEVVLLQSTPDHLTNLVLLQCSRPHGGIITIPVPEADAQDIFQFVCAAAAIDATFTELEQVLRDQLPTAS